jgi:hypothetical protein
MFGNQEIIAHEDPYIYLDSHITLLFLRNYMYYSHVLMSSGYGLFVYNEVFKRHLHIPRSKDLIQVSSVYSYMVVPTLSANPVHLGEEDHRAGHPNKVEGNDTDQVV